MKGTRKFLDKKNYLQYIKDVLGVSQIHTTSFREALNQQRESVFYSNQNYMAESHQFAFVNLVEDPLQSLFEPVNNELYEKIRDSIQLSAQTSYAMDSLLRGIGENLELLTEKKYNFDKILFFVSDEGDLLGQGASAGQANGLQRKWAVAPSPYLMIKKPELKKQAWEVLKSMRDKN